MIFFNISYLDNFIQLSHLIDAFPSYKTYKTASSGFFSTYVLMTPQRRGRGGMAEAWPRPPSSRVASPKLPWDQPGSSGDGDRRSKPWAPHLKQWLIYG